MSREVHVRFCEQRGGKFPSLTHRVAGFQYHADAARYNRAVEEQLSKFGLKLAKEKCAKRFFSRHRKSDSERFDFLGFEFRWGRTRHGSNVVKLRTSRKKLRKSLSAFTQWCSEYRNKRIKWLFMKLTPKIRGYYQYYGTTGNYRSLKQFYNEARRILYRSLNRRSERRSYNWKTYGEMLKHYRLEEPRIYWGWNKQMVLNLV